MVFVTLVSGVMFKSSGDGVEQSLILNNEHRLVLRRVHYIIHTTKPRTSYYNWYLVPAAEECVLLFRAQIMEHFFSSKPRTYISELFETVK